MRFFLFLSCVFPFFLAAQKERSTAVGPSASDVVLFEDSNLPLLIIETEQNAQIVDEPKVRAHMGIVDNGPNQRNAITDPFNDYDGAIAIEIRGASSQSFPKKNYSFETQKTDSSNNNVSLLGLPKENDWVLHGPYSDKSLLRNVLAYHLGAATGQYTPRTRLCEVLINGSYQGVYMLTEKIKQDKNRVDINPLEVSDNQGDALTGGYIFQIDRDKDWTTLDGWESSYPPHKFYAFHDPHFEDLTTEQRNFLKSYVQLFEAQMNSNAYAALYTNFIDRRSWVDYMLVTEIGKHIDAYKLSFYMHKKNVEAGGKIHFGPLWDFNLAFGNFDFVCSPNPTGWSYDFQGTCDFSHPFWIKKLMSIPQVQHEAKCRWEALRQGAFHTDSLMDFIDKNAALLSEAQERNFETWDILGSYVWPNSFYGATYAIEIDFLKTWLRNRLAWMDANMPGDCNQFVATDMIEEQLDVRLYPNPASDYIIIERQSNRNAEFLLFNTQLQAVQQTALATQEAIVQLGTLPAGLYFYQIKEGYDVLHVGKLLIE